jgi:hypothetical protein
MRIRINQAGIRELEESPEIVGQLGQIAQSKLPAARAAAPRWLEAQWLVRAGVGPRGAFAQFIARGSGAVLAEYGGQNSPAYAYIRRGLRSGR